LTTTNVEPQIRATNARARSACQRFMGYGEAYTLALHPLASSPTQAEGRGASRAHSPRFGTSGRWGLRESRNRARFSGPLVGGGQDRGQLRVRQRERVALHRAGDAGLLDQRREVGGRPAI